MPICIACGNDREEAGCTFNKRPLCQECVDKVKQPEEKSPPAAPTSGSSA